MSRLATSLAILLLGGLVLQACAAPSTPTPIPPTPTVTPTVTQTPVPTATATAIPAPTATSTPIPPTATPIPTPTPTITLSAAAELASRSLVQILGSSDSGTGIILGTDGDILTSARLIGKAETVTVGFTPAQRVTAQVIGIDEATDLALVRTERSDLTAATFGDSSDLGLGQDVLAMAYSTEGPFGGSITVSRDIIASMEQDLDHPGRTYIITNAFETTAYFGGPLINGDGEIVAVGVQGPGAEGISIIGLAAPSVQNLLSQLQAGVHFYRATSFFVQDIIFPMTYASAEVTINGLPAPDGTIVYVRIDDYVSEWRQVSDGRYPSLTISPPSRNYIDRPIVFYVGGFIAAQTGETFAAGIFERIEDFNLSVSGVPEF